MKKIIFFLIIAFSLIASLLWGMFFETTLALNITHLGVWHIRNNLALLTYSFTALFLLSLSLGILYLQFDLPNWTIIQRYLFAIGLLLSTLMTIAGIEFILYGELNWYDVYWLTSVKQIFILFLIGCILRIWFMDRNNSKPPEQ